LVVGFDWGWSPCRTSLYAFFGRQHERRLDPMRHVELAHRLLTVAIHSGGADAEPARNLLGLEVRGDEAKTLSFARGEQLRGAHGQQSSQH
jgi:hypothetical protein